MTHGLKSLAQELPKYGRYGDDMVAHISSDEAKLLKSLSGSGTINPHTGLPEFFSIGSVFKPVQQAIGQLNPLNPGSTVGGALQQIPGVKEAQSLGTQVFQPLEKAVVQPASAGLASFDKMVGKAIPGGWGTVAQVVASMIPGGQPLAVGIGALNGSGVMHKGGKFNLQGAMIGGATAYATSELGEYLRAANGTPDVGMALLPGADATAEQVAGQIANQTGSAVSAAPGSQAAMLADQVAGMGTSGAQNVASSLTAPTNSFGSNLLAGNFKLAADQAGNALYDIGKSVISAPGNAVDAAANYDYGAALKNAGQGMSDTTSGIGKVLTGNADKAATAAALKAGTMAPMMATAGTVYGVTSLAAMDEQRKYLDEAKAANAITQAEYDKAMGEVNRSAEEASKNVKENPFNANPNRDTSMDPTYYGRGNEIDNLYARMKEENRLYAEGGVVNPPDDQTGMPNESPLKNFEGGMLGNSGIRGYAVGGQIDMGNAYDPFANLPSLAGPIGGRSPDNGVPSTFAQSQNINPVGRFNDDFMGSMSGDQSNGSALGGLRQLLLGGQSSTPQTSTPQSTNYPSSNQNQNTTPGGFAGPSVYSGGSSGGGMGGNGAFPLQGQYGIVKMAAGGMAPRFLSGGGDGMSDSIPANIGGKQEARLADGEFVIPADVVSHLGNGSSKAGAKQLYSMMDKVRTARTGRKSQGKQINPRKYLAA
jgi:hypothetical protein